MSLHLASRLMGLIVHLRFGPIDEESYIAGDWD